MKKEVRKALAISGLAIALGTSGIVIDANASMMNGKNTRLERQMRGNSFGNKINNASGFMQRHRRIVPGIVTLLTDSSFKITRNEKTFTINTDETTRFLNLKWETINLSNIKIGDKIRVAGNISNTTITATTVRDISM